MLQNPAGLGQQSQLQLVECFFFSFCWRFWCFTCDDRKTTKGKKPWGEFYRSMRSELCSVFHLHVDCFSIQSILKLRKHSVTLCKHLLKLSSKNHSLWTYPTFFCQLDHCIRICLPPFTQQSAYSMYRNSWFWVWSQHVASYQLNPLISINVAHSNIA